MIEATKAILFNGRSWSYNRQRNDYDDIGDGATDRRRTSCGQQKGKIHPSPPSKLTPATTTRESHTKTLERVLSESTNQINEIKNNNNNKKSPSFIINYSNLASSDQHEQAREEERSRGKRKRYCRQQPESFPVPLDKRFCNYDHHRGCQNRLGSDGHSQRAPASVISPGATLLLALLALSCLLTSSLADGLSPQNDEGPTPNSTNGDDFYSTSAALSQQQQQRIPFSAIHSAQNNTASNDSVQLVEKRARAITAKRATRLGSSSSSSSPSQSLPPVPISESELLPFTEFIIQPPAFSDLMKSWPPTTLRAAASSLASAGDSPTNRQRQYQQQQQRQSTHRQAAQPKKPLEGQQDLRTALLMRNHLNEDLDDTIVTADQSFEREQSPEPETWINYLGDLGDYIYLQLKHYLEKSTTGATSSIGRLAGTNNKPFSSSNNNNNNNNRGEPTEQSRQQQQQTTRRSSQLKMETIDELLDDYYYDQYENSQVLYYGAQLVREHESFEIGCFLPIDQQAEWTKSGRPLPPDGQSSPRTILKTLFLNAKQNFTLKVFTASLSDSGNYRCSKMSRKFHKLIVVPSATSPNQIHAIQQRLLSVVDSDKVSAANAKLYQFKRTLRGSLAATIAGRPSSAAQLVPGYLIVDNEPLVVNCNISDPFVLQRLKENPQFRLAWYKNGKQLPGSKIAPPTVMSSAPNHHSQRGSGGAGATASGASPLSSARPGNPMTSQAPLVTHLPRIQFLDLNGRKLFIGSTQYSDAGEYLCSWSNLPAREMSAPDEEPSSELLATNGNSNNDQLAVAPAPPVAAALASNDQLEALSRNPLAAGSLSQLIVPVKLRPFKSTYHVRKGNQLRLACQVQRGYPQAQLNWYVGNRLVDADFLKEHAGQYKVLYLQNQNQVSALIGPPANDSDQSAAANSAAAAPPTDSGGNNEDSAAAAAAAGKPKIVEINPIPMGKLQMQLTQEGKWVEFRELDDEKANIDTSEQQLRYMQQKFSRLTGINISGSNVQQSRAVDADTLATQNQISLSVLIIESLDIERDTKRYACRATNRANTDEVTTVIRVQASSVVIVRPSTGRATLMPGQNLNFQCAVEGDDAAEFWWFKRKIGATQMLILDPDADRIELRNNRLQLINPNYDFVGDYICKKIYKDPDSQLTKVNHSEQATVKVRTQPIIEDFRIDTSHTGKSSTVRDGDRLELVCSVYDKATPVNITWLRSLTSDDENKMVALLEGELEVTTTTEPNRRKPWNQFDEDYTVQHPTHFVNKNQHGIEVQTIDPFSKRLVIESVSQEHRGYYACVVDNGITERTRKLIFIRVKDRLIALWPFLGILAEFFILFTIIKIWETQRFNYTLARA